MTALVHNKVFALADCNNFFVSCEQIFRPSLEGKPVVVLSSNDGCVVARSNEAKLLGIPMGAPAFKYRPLFEQHKIVKFSANFDLYGNISKRITELLGTITPRIEVYSVDESFLDLSELPITDYEAWGKKVSAAILRYIGVPVSIGIAPTKTLAKLAADIAKQGSTGGGAYSFMGMDRAKTESILDHIPVSEVWGVGRHLAPRVRAEGAFTALGLSKMRARRAQQLTGIHGARTVSELNGISCVGLTSGRDPAKSILRSRTFGEDTNEAYVLEGAIATLSAQAAFRLRCEGLIASTIGLFTTTSRHKPGYRQWSRKVKLGTPTNDPGIISSLLVTELSHIFNSTQQYHRLGVFLGDFTPEDALQTDLLGRVDTASHSRTQARMQALDQINKKWGKDKLHYAAEDISNSWQPKHQIRSPRYVSSWQELPQASIY